MTLCPGRETTDAAFLARKLNEEHSMASLGKENSGSWRAARAIDTTRDAHRFQDLKENVIETREVWRES